jgi:capsular exopolysaccharide synthesis family protein
VLRRHVLLLIATTLFGAFLGVVAFVVLLQVYPLYKGSVYFEVRPGLRESTDIAAADITNDDVVFRIAKTETYVLTSRDVLQSAVENPDIRQTNWHRQFLEPDGTFNVQLAVDDLQEDVRANVVRDSNLFSLDWSVHSASDVPIVLSNIARAYIRKRETTDGAVYTDNLAVFQSQVSETNREMDILGREISSFIREQDITTLDDVRFGQKAKAIELATEQKSNASANLSFALSSYKQVSAKLQGTLEPSPEDIIEAEQSYSVQSLTTLAQQLNTDMRLAYDKFLPGHAMVREAEARLRAAELQLEQKLDEVIRRNLEAEKKVLEEQIEQFRSVVASLQDQIDELHTELGELAADQAQLEAMEQRRDRLGARREAELQLIKEAQLMKMRSDAARVQVAQWPLTPRERFFPDIEIMVPLGALVLLALTTGIIFLREITDSRVKSSSDLSVIPGARVLGVIPELEEDPTKTDTAELAVRRHPQSVVAESYRQAMNSVMRVLEQTGYQTLLLGGGLPGAGTTTAVTNLAVAIAATGKTVLVVDANFRRPRLASAMGMDDEGPGLGDLLAGQATLDEAILVAEGDVSVLPAGTVVNRVFERLSSGRLQGLLAELRNRFDVIIFDAPPAVVAGEALVLANYVDAVVLVVRAYQEQRGLVARLINQLRDAPCELVGILLNRPRGTAGGYFKKNYATMADYSLKDSS